MNDQISNSVPVQAVFFDLDGTLLDTAPDLASALNALRQSKNRNPLPFDLVRNHVSQGSVALTRLGFPEIIQETEFEPLRQELLQYYADSICVDTTLFAEMEELLVTIEEQQVPWGIITNKPAWLTDPLLEALDLVPRAACVVSGDTLPQRKPHPDPLLHACELIGVSPAHSIYIGDDPRDIHAGNAAGMYTCVARYGYIESDAEVDRWGADFSIASPKELTRYIQFAKHIHNLGTGA